MPEAIITIRFAVPLDHLPGDYAVLYSNGGAGDIDWTQPHSSEQLDLFPGGAGNYGFGMAPFGLSPFGMPDSRDVLGFGQTPFGMSPFGIGCVVIARTVRISECGEWKFALKCFDAAGNAHEGTPNEATVSVHVAPPRPQGLRFKSYDPATDVLVLEVIDPTVSGFMPQVPSRLINLTGGPFEGYPGRLSSPSGDDLTWTDPGLPHRVTHD